jgi:hypothetical protein
VQAHSFLLWWLIRQLRFQSFLPGFHFFELWLGDLNRNSFADIIVPHAINGPLQLRQFGLNLTSPLNAALRHYEQHVADLQGAFGEGLTEANEEAASVSATWWPA